MAYTKQTWSNGDSSTPLSAQRLGHMEDGIAGAHDAVDGIDLSGLATKSEVTSGLAAKADQSALEAKADQSALDAKADRSELEAKADQSALAAKADESALTSHTSDDAVHVPGGGSTGQVLKRSADGFGWSNDTNTTYQTGTPAQLEAGTDTVGRLWSAKDIADYVAAKIAETAPETP